MIQENPKKGHPSREAQAVEWEEVLARLQGEQPGEDMEMEPGDTQEETPGKTSSSVQ